MENTLQEVTDWVEKVESMEDEDEETIDRDKFDSFSEWKLALIRRDGLRVGESYADNLGNYTIKSLDGKVTIERRDGKEEILELEILLERTIERYSNIIERERPRPQPRHLPHHPRRSRNRQQQVWVREVEEDYYANFPANEQQAMTLGWLSRYANIRVDIPPKDILKFNQDYYHIKNVFPDEDALRGDDYRTYYVYPETNKSYTYSLRLWFYFLPNFCSDVADCNVHEWENNPKQEISNNDFIKRLFRLGFGLGDNERHNHEEILANIPEQLREAFSRGANYTR